MGPVDWRDRSNRLCANLEALPVFRTARSVLAFASFRCEPDLSPLYDRRPDPRPLDDRLCNDGKLYSGKPDDCRADSGCPDRAARLWGFPRCEGRDLIWYQRSAGTPWTCGKYGINEPGADWPLVDLAAVEVMLVPAVAIDRSGGRLGYGGGFYDRCLQRPQLQGVTTIGIVFEAAYCDALPCEPWDLPLDYVCTETGVRRFSRSDEVRSDEVRSDESRPQELHSESEFEPS